MKQRLKILHVVPYFPPAFEFGGPVKLVSDLTKAQTRNGHRVTVLTTDVFDGKDRSNLPFHKKENNIEVYRLKNISNFLASKFNFYFSFQVFKFLKMDRKYDIIHFHDFRSINNFFISRYYLGKAAMIMSPYGSTNKLNKRFLKALFDLLFGRLIIVKISMFTAVNKIEQTYIQSRVKAPVEILPNSISLNDVEYISEASVRKELKIPKNKKIILFLSRLHKLKNPVFCVELFSKLSKTVQNNSVLVIVGPDFGEASAVRKKAAELGVTDRLIIHPFFIKNRFWTLLKISSVFMLPVLDSSFPLILLHSISQNTPIVTTDKSITNLPKNLGEVVELNLNKYKNAVESFLKNAKPKGGLKFVNTYYSLENYSRKLNQLYLKITK